MSISIAKEILNQLGSSRFLMFTGAYNLIALENGLQFKLPKHEGIKVNHVKITLTPMDVYEIDFGRVWGNKYTVLSTAKNVYCDELQAVFTEHTHLYTSF